MTHSFPNPFFLTEVPNYRKRKDKTLGKKLPQANSPPSPTLILILKLTLNLNRTL